MSINQDGEAGEYSQVPADEERHNAEYKQDEKLKREGDQENPDDDAQERSDVYDHEHPDHGDQERPERGDEENADENVQEHPEENDKENSNKIIAKHTDEENVKHLKLEVVIPEDKNQKKIESNNQTSSEADKSDTQVSMRPSQPKLPPMRSYLIMKRSSKQQQQQQQQQKLSPNRVQLEAAQLLPRLRHSQPGIGYYGKVRGRAPGRAVDLWSSHEPVGQPLLVLGPSPDLTGHFYTTSSSDRSGAAAAVSGVRRTVNAASVHGHYPFSRIVYPNLTGQRAVQSVRAAQQQQPMQRSLTHSGGEGTFVLRHKLRQSAGCLARVMDSSSTGEAAVKRAISRAK